MSTNATTPGSRLRELERALTRFDADSTAIKLDCLASLEGARLKSAREVLLLHEALCFLHAHPDDRQLLERVESMLAEFASRRDLLRFRTELADSGIVATDIHYNFYAPMARWLARRCGARLRIDWPSVNETVRAQLLAWLETFVTPAEQLALFELKRTPRAWLDRMRRDDESNASFLVRCFEGVPVKGPVRLRALEVLDLPYRLEGSTDGPSRTGARWTKSRVHFQTRPLRRARPVLTRAWREPPLSVRSVSRHDGQGLIDLAREAMVTRGRDLDSFAYGDPDDVRMVDCGEGLEFACIGLQQVQRNVLEAVYGFLTLMNGVPIGYVLASALFRSSEIAYNVFETYRGGEAGYVYGRVIGMVHALFGSDSFTVYPYQLGHGNKEGLRSGAWWFYQKLGFRPRDPELLRRMRDELDLIRADRSHRSSPQTLKQLAAKNVFWSPRPARDDIIGVFPRVELSLAITDLMARRFGSDRRRGETVLADEAAARLGASGWKRWPAAQQQAWRSWAPVLHLLPGLGRWGPASRRDLVKVVRAKGGRRESDFVRLFDAHRPLRRAMAALGKRVLNEKTTS